MYSNRFCLYHPSRSDIPSRDTCIDLTIKLQSFVFNVFGLALGELAAPSVDRHDVDRFVERIGQSAFGRLLSASELAFIAGLC